MDIELELETSTTTTKQRVIKLTGQQIIELLRKAGHDVPYNAEVSFLVPSGGDYSGMTVDIGLCDPVTVKWVEITEE